MGGLTPGFPFNVDVPLTLCASNPLLFLFPSEVEVCKLETLLQSEVTVVTASEAAAAAAADSAKTPPSLRRRKRNLSRRAGERERERDAAGAAAGGGGGVAGDRAERGKAEERDRRETGESASQTGGS